AIARLALPQCFFAPLALGDVQGHAAKQPTLGRTSKHELEHDPGVRDAVRGRENFFQLNRASCGEDGPIILTELLGCVGWPELRIGLPDHLAIGLVEDLLPQPVGIDVAALLVFHECDQGTVVHEGLEVCQAGTEGVLGPPTFSVLPFEELNSAPKLAGPLLASEFQLFLRLGTAPLCACLRPLRPIGRLIWLPIYSLAGSDCPCLCTRSWPVWNPRRSASRVLVGARLQSPGRAAGGGLL